MKLKLGFDFDGVVLNFPKLKSDAAKKLYGIDIPPERFKKEIVVEKYLTGEQYRELQKIVYETPEKDFLMEPVDGALEFLPRLVADGHTVTVVTSRIGFGLERAKGWALQKGLHFDFIGVGYGNSKAKAVKDLDVYVDDDLDKLKLLVGIVPYRLLFSWEYNAHLDVGTIIKRVASWEELYYIIQVLQAL